MGWEGPGGEISTLTHLRLISETSFSNFFELSPHFLPKRSLTFDQMGITERRNLAGGQLGSEDTHSTWFESC